jgi:trehalose 6-phosphate phosphatase
MKELLAGVNGRVLAQIAWSNALLAFDFDGTLAPIVAEPVDARMKPSTRKLMRELANVYPCIVISGRSPDDCWQRLDGVDLFTVIGNHGIESWWADDAMRDRVEGWAAFLRQELLSMPGVVVEAKGLSVAVHYRHSPLGDGARSLITRACRALDGARVFGGIRAVNIVPERAPDKGAALEAQRRRLGCARAFYIGDDETDEDAFALSRTGRVLAVRVGRSRSSSAPYFIKKQGDIDVVLSTLLRLRRQGLGPRSA